MKNPEFDPYQIAKKHVEKAVPLMRYDGKESPEAWQERARGVLSELLGLSKFKEVDPDFTIEYDKNVDTEKFSGREIRFTVKTEPGFRVPCVLWIPKDTPVPMPVAICLQGHSTGMHISRGQIIYAEDEESISGGDRAFAVDAVKEGFATLTVEMRCMGELGNKEKSGSPDCYATAMTMLLTGRTLLGARVWDVMRVIDMLYHFPELDRERILCMGNSGGGTVTVYVSAVDERITASMPSCSFCDYSRSIAYTEHCACNYIPSIANFFDMGDIAALIAPRPFVAVYGKDDNIFLKDGVLSAMEVTRRVYREMNQENKTALVEGFEGHRFYKDLAYPALQSVWDYREEKKD